MNRREQILYATLELAAERGLESVSLAQIAERVGIRTPSLYNHFGSKEELVSALYEFIREQAKQLGSQVPVDYAALAQTNGLEEALTLSLEGYIALVANGRMLQLLKVVYSARSTSPAAARILLDEVNRMVEATKSLFYALVVHGKMRNEAVDTAAISYAMTLHAMLDHEMDQITASGEMGAVGRAPHLSEEMRTYIAWFSTLMGTDKEGRHA